MDDTHDSLFNFKVIVQYYLATFWIVAIRMCTETHINTNFEKGHWMEHTSRSKVILKTYDFLYLKINTESNKIMYRPFHTT